MSVLSVHLGFSVVQQGKPQFVLCHTENGGWVGTQNLSWPASFASLSQVNSLYYLLHALAGLAISYMCYMCNWHNFRCEVATSSKHCQTPTQMGCVSNNDFGLSFFQDDIRVQYMQQRWGLLEIKASWFKVFSGELRLGTQHKDASISWPFQPLYKKGLLRKSLSKRAIPI